MSDTFSNMAESQPPRVRGVHPGWHGVLCILLLGSAALVCADAPIAPAEPSAQAAPEGPHALQSVPPPGQPVAASANAPAAVLVRPQPRDSLDSDLVYAVLVAELAGRRGDMAMAHTHYLHAAQLARDGKMAELAVRAAITGQDDAGADRAVALWLELDPQSLGANQVAAMLRLKAGDREGALTHLGRIIQIAGSGGESGYLQVAGIAGRAAGAQERVGLMRDLVALDAGNPDAQQALALVAASADQNDVAVAAARRALELRPGWDKPQLFLVRLLLAQGKRAEARSQIETFVAASPEDQALRMLYGQFLVEEKEFSSARGVFERVLDNRPKEPDVLFAVGILSLELGDLDAARGYLTRLHQTGERIDEASFYLGQVEEKAEHPAAAIAWYNKAQGANLVDARSASPCCEPRRVRWSAPGRSCSSCAISRRMMRRRYSWPRPRSWIRSVARTRPCRSTRTRLPPSRAIWTYSTGVPCTR